MKLFEIFLCEDVDMSQQARIERARSMGFDTSKVWYTGTPFGDIEEFDPNRTSDEDLAFGQGIYTTNDPDAASGYSRPGASWGNDTDDPSPTVYPVFLKVKNPFDLEKNYPYVEVKRLLSHIEDSELLAELEEDVAFSGSYETQLSDAQEELENWQNAHSHEDVDQDDYDDVEDYERDLDDAIKSEIEYYEKKIAKLSKWDEEERRNHAQAVASGKRGGKISGRAIYKELWTNTDDYHDWRQESKLIGGDTGTFEFKTEANHHLEDMGYDGITHKDYYNPGTIGVPHTAMIVFHANQIRSIHAAFDPNKAASGKITD